MTAFDFEEVVLVHLEKTEINERFFIYLKCK